MKRIAIFIDGTWNRPDAEHPTNVLRLSRCVFDQDGQGNTQQVIYSAGVGSGVGNNWLGKKMDRIFGGALGWGLMDLIEAVYRDLVFAYQPGDEVYIFGFSRGGFAARSLAGLIRSCGIPPRRHVGRIPEAIARYVSRDKDTKPDDPSSFAFREDFAPYTATSDTEFQSRIKRGDSSVINLKLAYLGIWDTVAALGIPAFLPGAARFNAKYTFHDSDLSRSVMAARHAIAIDERRKTFPPLPWANLDKLNSGDETRETPLYMQQWFPGNHGSVGGGGGRVGLSSVPLIWVTQGAEQAGLRIDWREFDRVATRFEPVKESLNNKFGPAGLSGLIMNNLQIDRDGPKEVEDVSVATLDRFRADPDYRPATLNFVRDDLHQRPASELDALRDFLVARDGGPTHEIDSTIRPREWEAPRNAALPSDN